MKRLRFVHIPKTAGMTLRYIILKKYQEKQYFLFTGDTSADIRRYLSLSEKERRKIELYIGHMPLTTGNKEVDQSTAITFLREPIARVKSLCQYVSEGNWKDYLPGPFNLDRFLSSGNQQLFNHQTKFLINTGSDSSHDIITKLSPATARDLALENLFTKVAQFGIQKYFDESLMLFCKLLHWRIPFYQAVNKKDSGRLLEFKQRHLDSIAELNSIDIEVYNAAEKKFVEILASSKIDMAKLKRFKFMNSHMTPLLKSSSRIKGMLRGLRG